MASVRVELLRLSLLAVALLATPLGAQIAPSAHGHGVLVRIDPAALGAFSARHRITPVQLAPGQNLYWVVQGDSRSDAQLLQEIDGDGAVQSAELNAAVNLIDDQSGMSVLNQAGLSVLNMESRLETYGSAAQYGLQPAMNTIDAQDAGARATGQGVVIALIDNGVDPENAVLRPVLLNGYNFFSDTPNWSCYADLTQAKGASASDDPNGVTVLRSADESAWQEPSRAGALNAVQLTTFTDSQADESGVSVLGDSGADVADLAVGGGMVTTGDGLLYGLLQANPEIGHGTAVAGLLHVVAPQALLLPIKAFGPAGTADLAGLLGSIYYAVARGANVIDMSFSSRVSSRELSAALQYAWRHNVVLVAAAGNDATAQARYPGAYPEVLGVAALGSDDNPLALSSFSDYGATVALAAPGYNLITTFADNEWASVAGTSFSAPLVAGEAALVEQILRPPSPGSAPGSAATSPAAVPGVEVDALILSTANPDIPANAHHAVGAGVIQVDRALLQESH